MLCCFLFLCPTTTFHLNIELLWYYFWHSCVLHLLYLQQVFKTEKKQIHRLTMWLQDNTCEPNRLSTLSKKWCLMLVKVWLAWGIKKHSVRCKERWRLGVEMITWSRLKKHVVLVKVITQSKATFLVTVGIIIVALRWHLKNCPDCWLETRNEQQLPVTKPTVSL